MLVEMRGQDLRITRVSHRIPIPSSSRSTSSTRIRGSSRWRPSLATREEPRENPVHVKAIHQPAGEDLARGVGQKKEDRGFQLRRRDSQFIFEQRRRNREIPAIDVVDGDGENQQDYHASQGARDLGRGRVEGNIASLAPGAEKGQTHLLNASVPFSLVRAVVGELRVDAEIGLAEQLDDCWRYRGPAGDAHEIAWMEACTRSLLSLIFFTISRAFRWDALLQRDLLAHGGAGGRNDLSVSQSLSGTLRRTSWIPAGPPPLELEFVWLTRRLVVLLVELDVGLRVFQVVALVNFLQRLLDGIDDFRYFDFGDDVEGVVGISYSGAGNRVLRFRLSMSNPRMEPVRTRSGFTGARPTRRRVRD